MIRKLFTLFAALSVLALSGMPAPAAQGYPERPITIVVPFGAGGETDLVARMLADNMHTIFGQNVVVQNIVGAAGVTGMSAITSAKPDGYTLGVVPSAPLAMHPHMRQVPYSLESFEFIGRILKAPYIVLVNKTSPWKTFDDMIKDMKANPDKYFWASSGVGSVPYIALMNLFNEFGVKVKHVPFSGDADALQAMAGDRAQIYASTAGVLGKYDVKGLALLDAERDPLLPDLPSIKECVPADKQQWASMLYVSQWMALIGPKGLPADVLAKLNAAMGQACAAPEFVADLKKLGLVPGYQDSKACEAFIREESDRNAVTIKKLMQQQQ